jgi:GT2 family glycosyltransferase
MRTPGLSLVVTNWNGRALLETFLPSIVEAARAFESDTGEPTEILVADDASTDDSGSWLRTHWPQVRFESGSRQQGFAPTANRGVRASRFAMVYLVNNDVALAPTTLGPLAAHLRDPNVFAVSGNAYDYSTGVLRGAGQRGKFRRGFLSVHSRFFVAAEAAQSAAQTPPRRAAALAAEPVAKLDPLITLYATGGSSLFDRDKFLALGGFEEMLAPYGWEDVELSLRAWKQGFEVHYEPGSAIWHRFSSTIGSRVSARRVTATYERNRLLAHWLHLDTRGQRAAHALGVTVKLLTSPILGRTEYWKAVGQALRLRSKVRARRAELRQTQRRTLAEVLSKIEAQMSRPEIRRLQASSAPVRPYVRASIQAPREQTS